MNRARMFPCPYGCKPFSWLQAIKGTTAVPTQVDGRDAIKKINFIQCPICTRSVTQGDNEWLKGADVKIEFVGEVKPVKQEVVEMRREQQGQTS